MLLKRDSDKGEILSGLRQKQGKRTGRTHCPAFRPRARVWMIPLFLCLCLPVLPSCHRNRTEDIPLPYGKKRYDTSLWKAPQWKSIPDTLGKTERDSLRDIYLYARKLSDFPPYTVMAHALDSNLQPRAQWSGFSVFFWLQSPCFGQERQNWEEKEKKAERRYLGSLRWKEDYHTSPLLQWDGSNLSAGEGLEHGMEPIGLQTSENGRDETEQNAFPTEKKGESSPKASSGRLILHLFYHNRGFENGLNPVVLIPYASDMGRYAIPPESFFEKGGILAVLGHAGKKTWQDSSLYFARRDTLLRLMATDLMFPTRRRKEYQAFLQDSNLHRSLIRTRTETVLPVIRKEDLLQAVNFLIAKMYTTPEKLAVIASGENALPCESLLFERSELFKAAYLVPRPDSLLTPLWESFPARETASLREFPALLMEKKPSHFFLLAFLQERNGRVCGEKPALLCTDPDAESLWKFLLYQIGKEENFVTGR